MSRSNPQVNSSLTGKYKIVSSAKVYKMHGALIHLLRKMEKQLPATLYENMYGKLIHLSAIETQRLHTSLEAGHTSAVFDFLSNGATRHFKLG